MRNTACLFAFLALALAAPVLAWKGSLASGVQPIAEVRAKAESGDLVTVEGTITEVGSASGSRYVVTLEDGTGSVLVRVPEYLLRQLNEGRAPEKGRRVRVSGQWTRAYLDQDIWGIQASNAERVE
jgi:hypothetical protein